MVFVRFRGLASLLTDGGLFDTLNFEVDYFSAIADSIRSFTETLTKVLDTIRKFSIRVIDYFKTIYVEVVGSSYWPDTMRGVLIWASETYTKVLDLTARFAKAVMDNFKSIADNPLETVDAAVGNAIAAGTSINFIGIGRSLSLVLISAFEDAFNFVETRFPRVFASLGNALFLSISKFIGLSFLNVPVALAGAVSAGLDPDVIATAVINGLKLIGTSLGQTFGIVIASLPNLLFTELVPAIYSLGDAFYSAFLEQIPLIGDALKALLDFSGVGIIIRLLFGTAGAIVLVSQIEAISKAISKLIGLQKAEKGFGLLATIIFGKEGKKNKAGDIVGEIPNLYKRIQEKLNVPQILVLLNNLKSNFRETFSDIVSSITFFALSISRIGLTKSIALIPELLFGINGIAPVVKALKAIGAIFLNFLIKPIFRFLGALTPLGRIFTLLGSIVGFLFARSAQAATDAANTIETEFISSSKDALSVFFQIIGIIEKPRLFNIKYDKATFDELEASIDSLNESTFDLIRAPDLIPVSIQKFFGQLTVNVENGLKKAVNSIRGAFRQEPLFEIDERTFIEQALDVSKNLVRALKEEDLTASLFEGRAGGREPLINFISREQLGLLRGLTETVQKQREEVNELENAFIGVTQSQLDTSRSYLRAKENELAALEKQIVLQAKIARQQKALGEEIDRVIGGINELSLLQETIPGSGGIGRLDIATLIGEDLNVFERLKTSIEADQKLLQRLTNTNTEQYRNTYANLLKNVRAINDLIDRNNKDLLKETKTNFDRSADLLTSVGVSFSSSDLTTLYREQFLDTVVEQAKQIQRLNQQAADLISQGGLENSELADAARVAAEEIKQELGELIREVVEKSTDSKEILKNVKRKVPNIKLDELIGPDIGLQLSSLTGEALSSLDTRTFEVLKKQIFTIADLQRKVSEGGENLQSNLLRLTLAEESLSSTLDFLTNQFTNLRESIGDFANSFATVFVESITTLDLKSFGEGFVDLLLTSINNSLIEQVSTFAKAFIAEFFSGLDAAEEGGQKVAGFLKSVLGFDNSDAIKDAESLGATVANKLGELPKTISTATEGLKGVFGGLPDLFSSLFSSLGSLFGSGGGNVFGSLFSSFAGLFDSGGYIPRNQYGIVGERGAEIVSGPARVIGREDTEKMLNKSNTNNITFQLEGDFNARAERAIRQMIASGSLQRGLNQIDLENGGSGSVLRAP